MKNDMQTVLSNYFAQQRKARIITETVRETAAQTFIAKLVARMLVTAVGVTLFFAVSPTVGFVALMVGLFIL